MKILFTLFLSASLSSCISTPFDTKTSSGGGKKKDPNETERKQPGVQAGMNIEANKLFEMVNEYRQSRGLAKLKPHKVAIEESDQHSYNMAKEISDFGHDGWNDNSGSRYNTLRASEDSFRSAGENVAHAKNAERALLGLKGSWGHNRKMLKSKWTHSGIGAHKKPNGNWYYTQIFMEIKD